MQSILKSYGAEILFPDHTLRQRRKITQDEEIFSFLRYTLFDLSTIVLGLLKGMRNQLMIHALPYFAVEIPTAPVMP